MLSGFAALLIGNVKVSSITPSGIWVPPTFSLQTGEVLQIPTFVLSKPCQQALLAGGSENLLTGSSLWCEQHVQLTQAIHYIANLKRFHT
jgi:hypothetical protein